jgi:ubiquitin carboxyl-terminal hydrolase 16
VSDIVRVRKRKSPNNRWWRISDEKIKESKTSDLLGMQKEVYLLFYELEAGDDDA